MPVATLKQFAGAVERGCDFPLYYSLSDSRVCEMAVTELDFINNELGLTGRPWNYSSFPLTVQVGEDYHAITEVGDFTVPIAVETTDPSNPQHVVRVLVLDDPVDAVRWKQAGTLGAAGVAHSALSVAFTEMPGQPGVRAARFAPKPNAQATYNVIYTPNVIRPQSLQDQITKFPQFEPYIFLRVLMAALPYCEWEGMDDEKNANKRATIQGNPQMPGSNAYRFAELSVQFMRLRRQSHQNHLGRVRPFGILGRIGRR